MKNNQVLILLCANLGKSDNFKPFNNSDIYKIINKLKIKGNELSDLYGKSIEELKEMFFDNNVLTEIENNFIYRINSLLLREANIAISMIDIKKWGIDIITIYDELYPQKIKNIMGEKSPALLYYCGDLKILENNFIGFSGSRIKKTDKGDEIITKQWANFACDNKFGIVAGGASGVDTFAVQEAIAKNACFVEFVANSMIERIRIPQISSMIQYGKGLILSEANPFAPFNVGMAMSRNKYIYMISKYTIVIKAVYTLKNGKKTGGTWNGAIENLKSKYKRVLVFNDGKTIGNKELIDLGAIAISAPEDEVSRNIILGDTSNYNKEKKVESVEVANEEDKELILILKKPETLAEIKLTKKEQEDLPKIKLEIEKVTNSFEELNLNKKLIEKLKRFCMEQKAKSKQLSIFDIM